MLTSLRRSGLFVGLLLTFVQRRVLRLGVMHSRGMRIAVGCAVLTLVLISAVAAYAFLRGLEPGAREWGLLFAVSTTSVVLWTQVAFLFVKVLFMSGNGILELTAQLPLTGRERAVGLLVYECLLTCAVGSAGVVGLVASALALQGTSAISPILISVVLPAMLTYAGLSLLWLSGDRLLVVLGVRRTRPVILLFGLFVLLGAYLSALPGMTADLTGAYLDGEVGGSWVGSLEALAAARGDGVAIVAGVAAGIALSVAAVAMTPSQHVPQARFVKVWLPTRWALRLGPYVLSSMRSTQTLIATLATVAVFVVLELFGSGSPAWALSVMSFNALYQFAATAPLRRVSILRRSSVRVYGQLVLAQTCVVALVGLPVAGIATALEPATYVEVGRAVMSAWVGALLALGVGIGFPAEEDNPFSVILGLVASVTIAGLAVAALGVLQLPAAAMWCAAVLAAVGVALYSIAGIDLEERKWRNEGGNKGREQSGGGSGYYRSDSRGDDSRPHVHLG